ncbi:type II toxin-antitoxin system RelE/ParE family toxin [Marivirga sp.]|uniref:type II toxin-antitoxin system RelE/ParE family toxin n=1 Tax=Marivirga sp. TaxID=2018662 RepID=UPI003DA74CD6
MARRVIWADTAKNQLHDIILYWNRRNKSKTYSRKLRKHLKSILRLIVFNPNIGKKTNYPDKNVRSKTFMKNFQIIYQVRAKELVILNFWDSRQDSERNDYL